MRKIIIRISFLLIVIAFASRIYGNSFTIKGKCVELKNVACLHSIEYEEQENEIIIYLMIKNNYQFSANLFNDPLRVGIDLWPIINGMQAEIPINGQYIERIRTSQFQPAPEYKARVVVDLKNLSISGMDYSLAKEGERLLLKIERKSSETGKEKNNEEGIINADNVNKVKIEEEQIKMEASKGTDYTIGSEDLLEIRVFELPELNNTVRVSSDGKINIPPLGDVEIAGLTKSAAEKKISELLQKNFVNDAHVVIFIKEYRSQKVNIIGAVNKPGNYAIMGEKSLLEILSDAGGLSDKAGEKLYVFRRKNSQIDKIEINLKELLEQGKEKFNIMLKPGDIINIPEVQKIIIYLYGEVLSPGAIEMKKDDATLLKAITKAGGPTDRANLRKIIIKRLNEDKEEKLLRINLKDIINGKLKDELLEDGDVIIVPESFF